MKKKQDNKEKLQRKITNLFIEQIPTFKLKNYSHFDRPYTLSRYIKTDVTTNGKRYIIAPLSQQKINQHIKALKYFLSSPDEIAKHAFYPFIGFDIVERRSSIINRIKYYESLIYKLTGEERTKCQERLNELKVKGIKKLRPIRYSAHIDGYIYSHYAKILSEKYEEKISQYGLEKEILAYRTLPPVIINGEPIKPNNCTMASEIFKQIKERNNNCYALAFDISGFYDHIDHANLYKEWCNVLDVEKLPADHLNIFKSLTKYCYIDLKEICLYVNGFKNSTCSIDKCKDCKKNINRKIPKILFKTAKEFRIFKDWYKTTFSETDHKKFHKNPGYQETQPYGIPQGSAMSALLSNIYMLPFDIEMKKLADKVNGVYRRYCDDIMFICSADEKLESEIEIKIKDEIKQRGPFLKIHPIDKWDKYSKSQCYDFTNIEQIKKQPLQYLGFYFDGKQVRIREGSLARYLRKSKRAVTAMKLNAKKKIENMHKKGIPIQGKHTKLYRSHLYELYTHRGKRNFISYVFRAFENFDKTVMKQQIKNHDKRLNALISIADVEIKECCEKLLQEHVQL